MLEGRGPADKFDFLVRQAELGREAWRPMEHFGRCDGRRLDPRPARAYDLTRDGRGVVVAGKSGRIAKLQ